MSSRVLCIIFILVNFSKCVFCDFSAPSQELSIASYTKCQVDNDCFKLSNHSFCFNNDADKLGYCKCRDGYEMVSRNKTYFACLGPAGYGEQCDKNMQCQLILTENAECYNSVCRCKDGAHLYSDKKCYVSVLLDDFCRSDGNCWMTGDVFGNCVSGRCTCRFDKEVPTTDKRSCVDGKNLGEQCDNDAQCALVDNTQCRVSCKCAPNFVLSRDQTKCLRAATRISDSCIENEQCSAYLQGSVCLTNNCTCSSGYHSYGTRCVKSVPLGGSCLLLEECISDPEFSNVISCNNGRCECLPGVHDERFGCSEGVTIRFSLILLLGCIFYRFFIVS